jgi:glutaminyl-peptide cyclotransferase
VDHARRRIDRTSMRHIHKIGLIVFTGILAVLHAHAAPVMGYKIIARFPHSTANYTEGFFYLDGLFYEGTGLEGHSALFAIQPESGIAIRSVALPSKYFGEGIVDWGAYIYEWTWQSNVCFVYNRSNFQLVKQLSYSGEGWGMTRMKDQLVTSDGSTKLTFRDPKTLNPIRSITVHDGATKIGELNELEFIKGEIYANIWHTDKIVRISPSDGHVIAWIDLTGLLPANERVNQESVLNGIAYDAKHDRLFVTGKQWPAVFQIQVTKKP